MEFVRAPSLAEIRLSGLEVGVVVLSTDAGSWISARDVARKVVPAAVVHGGAVAAPCVELIATHGTGTPLGDPIETGAISNALGKVQPGTQLSLSSVKATYGHTEGTAGTRAARHGCLRMHENTAALAQVMIHTGAPGRRLLT